MPFRKKKVEEIAAPKKAAAQKKKVEKKVAVPVVNCRCDELEARVANLETRLPSQHLLGRVRDAVNDLLKAQANGRKKNLRQV